MGRSSEPTPALETVLALAAQREDRRARYHGIVRPAETTALAFA